MFTIEEDGHIPTIPTRVTEKLSDINISEKAIFYKLLSLNGNKVPGPDALHPYFLKSCAASVAKPLSLLIKQSLNSGTLPDLWKKANVTPIFNKFQPSNYTEANKSCISSCEAYKITDKRTALGLSRPEQGT